MATKKPMKKFKRYDEGGFIDEATAKQRGLDISNKEEPVGFFERIRAGNIDQPGTEAYNRFGAGRAYAKNMDDENEAMRAANRAPSAPAAPAASSRPLSDDMYSDFGSSTGRGAAGTSETIKPTRQVMTKPQLPATKPTAPDKQSTGFYMPPSTRDNPNYSNEGRGKPAPAAPAAPAKPTMDTKSMNENAKKAAAEDPTSMLGAAGAGAAALFGASKLGKMFKGAKKAAEKASPYLKEIPMDKKKLTGPKKSSDVTDVVAKKRGGAVKKYASGGMVSSASKRADGIASKGKTRCKIC
jgi:hypothetical protein